MKTKRSLWLFEIMTALFIVSILFTGLMRLFYQNVRRQHQVEQVREAHLELELCEYRIKSLFTHLRALYSGSHPEAVGTPLIMDCVFPKPNQPGESCSLTAMLFVNKSQQLCLAFWRGEEAVRNEVLLSSVKQAPFRFFSGTKWHPLWSSQQEKLPLMVELNLHWKEEAVPYVFFCGDVSTPIHYARGSP